MNTLEIPLDHITVKKVTQYKTRVIVDLNRSATILIDLYEENHNGIPVTSIGKVLNEEEYHKWGDDDSYIEGIVLSEIDKLRTRHKSQSPLTIEIPEPEEEPEEEQEPEPEPEPVKKTRKPRSKKL